MGKNFKIKEDFKSNDNENDEITLLKSMLFHDEEWMICQYQMCSDYYLQAFDKKLSKDTYNKYLKVINILNTDKKYKNVGNQVRRVASYIYQMISSEEEKSNLLLNDNTKY